MTSHSKPRKAGLRSKFRRLFSSSSVAERGIDSQRIGQDLQAPVPLHSGEKSHVPVARVENTHVHGSFNIHIDVFEGAPNDLSRIVPTIACQLGQHHPTLQDYIRKAIEKDRLIFTKTVRIQMNNLIVRPFQQFCATGVWDPGRFPHAIIIDGLDERSGEGNQEELLSSIKSCFLDNDLPFRLFIARRPEWANSKCVGVGA